MKNRVLITVVLIACLLFTFTACTSKTEEPVVKQDNIKGKLVVWVGSGNIDNIKTAAENFKKIHGQADIQLQEMNYKDLYDGLSLALTNNSGLPDEVVVQDEYVPYLVKNNPGHFVEGSDILGNEKNSFLQGRIDAASVDGKLYGVPLNSEPMALYYRSDLFLKAGINISDIKTWGDYVDAAKKIKEAAGSRITAFSLVNDDSVYRMFLNQLGTSYYDKDNNPMLSSGKSLKVLNLIKRMLDEGAIYNVDAAADTVLLAKTNRIASIIGGPEVVSELESKVPELKGKWAVTKLPAFEEGGNQSAVINGASLLVIRKENNKDLAYEFAKFISMDKESLLTEFNKFSAFPSYMPVYDEEIFDKKEEYFSLVKVWDIYCIQGKNLANISYSRFYPVMKDRIAETIFQILFRSQDLGSTMDSLQKETEKVIGITK